jgi:hypothetical protein
MNLSATLAGVSIPAQWIVPFVQQTLENATDIETLDQTNYTDFISHKPKWEINFGRLSEAEFDSLMDIYRNQFVTGTYPQFVLPYYSIDTPVRMYVSDMLPRKDGCDIMDFTITLLQKAA